MNRDAASRLQHYQGFLERDVPNARFRSGYAWNMIANFCKPKRLLDVGCGSGEFLCLAIENGVEEVVGVERPKELVNQESRGEFKVERLDIESNSLPFADNSFDSVVCMEVLEHLYDPGKVVREFARTVVPGGTVLISVPNQYHIATRIRVLCGYSISPALTVGGHIKFFQISDLKTIASECGLVVQCISGLAYPTAYPKYGALIRYLLKHKPDLFATWLFLLATKARDH